ncbi:MAG: hypothetical protein RIQ89_786 [Bacteroidota bacterium]|jgi:aminomuconate-semialdehyde/2-hydroxymuconate-6-semialdehyde dehydrogenase
MIKIENLINGQLIAPINNLYFDNINPATGQIYAQIPDSTTDDVALAITAATNAFPLWSQTPAAKRSKVLLKIAELIEKNLPELARAESIDNGKPLSLATAVDIPRAAANFHFYGTGILHHASNTHSMEATALNYTLKQPIGVAGCISPWNLPLYLFSWKIAPALAAGCTVVAKPSEVTPMTAYLLSKICIEAGLPPGVLNIVHGTGPKVGAAIVQHPHVPVISFTGGTQTGAWIAAEAAPKFKKLSLELGGKNPNIIFADADFDHAVATSIKAAFSNQGEICLCGSRIFIERSIYEKFKIAFVAKAKSMQPGNPLDAKTQIGAIVSKNHFEKILSHIAIAHQEGGTLLCGGTSVCLEGENKDGFFIAPTVFENLDYNCRTNQEEIFGPVVTLMPFDQIDEVIRYANSVKYGLSATIFTTNLQKAHKLAADLHCGIVWINTWLLRDLRTPFGGTKASGLGREGGFEAINFFMEEKNVCIKL